MTLRSKTARSAYVLACAIAAYGCGGGGVSVGNAKGAPTATTKSNVAAHILALGQGALSMSFESFGTSITSHHGKTFERPMLGLWDTLTIAPDGIRQVLTLDSAGTQPAGQIVYVAEDAGLTLAGTMSLTGGPYAGLNGSYLQSVVPGGVSGNEEYTVPALAVTSGEFSLAQGPTGALSGTEQFAVALAGGYTQNQQVALNSDASEVFTTTDSNRYRSVLSFSAAGSGAGNIQGADPGLPATLAWDSTGSGKVTFADGSSVPFTCWQMAAAQTPKATSYSRQ